MSKAFSGTLVLFYIKLRTKRQLKTNKLITYHVSKFVDLRFEFIALFIDGKYHFNGSDKLFESAAGLVRIVASFVEFAKCFEQSLKQFQH